MANEVNIGRHITSFEAPDIIYMRLNGAVSPEEGSELNRLHREFGEGRDSIYYLIDLEHLESIHPEVRKESGLVLRTLPLRGAVIFQAPLKARVIAKLILTAMNMFRTDEEKVPVRFAPTEEEARSWIATRREEERSRVRPASQVTAH